MKLNHDIHLDISHALNSAKILLELREILQSIDLQKDDYTIHISTVIDMLEQHIAVTSDLSNLDGWRLTILGLKMLKSYLQCRCIAQGRPGDINSEREKLAFFCDEFQIFVSEYINLGQDISQVGNQIVKQDGRSINAGKLIDFLLRFPLSTTYLKTEDINFPFPKETQNDKLPSPLVRLIAFIDNTPLVSPQLLQSKVSYSLTFKISGVVWLEDSQRLHLQLLTTFPSTDYSVSPFILEKPTNIKEYDYEEKIHGQIHFNVVQSILADNIFFTIKCLFELSDGNFQEVPVIGYNQLEFRIDDYRKPLLFSGYKTLDLHMAKLVRNLLDSNHSIRHEMVDTYTIVESLTRLLGIYTQEGTFKGCSEITETDFQKDVVRNLRLMLGEDIKEHTAQAGGYTDITYLGVVIELKVEKVKGDRQYICEKYTKQATQYQGVESRQVSIVLVLDLTPKDNPPGDIRNDIFLVDVPTHGGSDSDKEYPSKSFVFIVNGNIKNPSEYSKDTAQRKPKAKSKK